MAPPEETLPAVTTRLPKERLAQLDRLALRRGCTRSRLMRVAVEQLLEESEEPLRAAEQAALDGRRSAVKAMMRLAEIRKRSAPRGVSSKPRVDRPSAPLGRPELGFLANSGIARKS